MLGLSPMVATPAQAMWGWGPSGSPIRGQDPGASCPTNSSLDLLPLRLLLPEPEASFSAAGTPALGTLCQEWGCPVLTDSLSPLAPAKQPLCSEQGPPPPRAGPRGNHQLSATMACGPGLGVQDGG